MKPSTFTATCGFHDCGVASPTVVGVLTLIVWLMRNRWEVAWHFETDASDASFRFRCPRH